MEKQKIKTSEEAVEEIRKSGLSIAKWAKRNGVRMQAAYDVLRGRSLGLYGESHKAAVLLGMKAGTIETEAKP